MEDSESKYNENQILRAKISGYENTTEATLNQSRTKSDTIKQLKLENSELQELVKNTERESKGLKKSLSEKEKELYNLVKESKDEAEQSQILKSKFAELTNTVNHEKKQQERKLKKKENKDFINELKNKSETPTYMCVILQLKRSLF